MQLTEEKLVRIDKYIRVKLSDIHQYQKDVYEFCLNEGKLHMQYINKQTVYDIVGNIDQCNQSLLRTRINQILTQDRIRFIKRIQYVGNPDNKEDTYEIDRDDGVITVYVAPIKPQIKDNAFINDYLKSIFGDYAEFIKRYMAAYAFTNFKRLPTLVFYGPRGTSKTTFVDSNLRSIYPNMHIDWNGLPNTFNPEVEKKLAVIEENAMLSKEQYNQLKSVTGAEFLFLNQKYKEKVAVRNNLQIVLISNKGVPMYVAPSEYPLSDLENQWFVWKFDRFEGKPDGSFGKKLKARLGHYIQTELRSLFENNSSLFREGRYTIRTPITEYEQALFDANRSVEDMVSQRIRSELLEDYESFLKQSPSDSNNGIVNFSKDKMISLNLLHNENFLTNELIRSYDLEDARLSSITNYLENTGILGKSKRQYHKGNEYRGRFINQWKGLEELRADLNSTS